MSITINDTTYFPAANEEIATALWKTSQLTGIVTEDPDDLAIRGFAVDYYLLTATLAIRIAAGDLILIDKADTAGKRAYQEKLIREIRNNP